MKLRIKILFLGIIVLVSLFSISYVFLISKGKAIIIQRLKDLTQKEVNIGYLGLTLPLNLEIKDLDIRGLVRVNHISVSPSILSLFTGDFILNDLKITKPEVTYEKVSPETTELPAVTAPAPGVSPKPPEGRPLHLIVKHINIKDGKVNFIDRTLGKEPLVIAIKDINFDLTNLYLFPQSAITNFELKGKIPWQQRQEEGKIEASGWLNLFKKDMQVTLKIEDIDGIYLYPYYANWVDLEKARIEKAKLNFISELNSFNNDLTVKYRLELTDIVFKPRSPEEEERKAEKIAHAVLGIFKALNQDKIVLEHTFKTKMDRPEFGFGNIHTAFEEKLTKAKKTEVFKPQDVLTLPSKLIEGTVKGATDLTKAVIVGAVGMGKGIKEAVEETFKKEPKEKEEQQDSKATK